MAEERLIQINLQLPVSELAGVTALVEQVRQLLATGGKQVSTSHRDLERNTNFDETRFQELAGSTAQADQLSPSETFERAEPSLSDIPEAKSSKSLTFSDAEAPMAQSAISWQQLQVDTVDVEEEMDLSIPNQEPAVENELNVNALQANVEDVLNATVADSTIENTIDADALDAAVDSDILISSLQAVVETDINEQFLQSAVENDISERALRTAVESDISVTALRATTATDVHSEPSRESVERHIAAPSTAGFEVSDNISSFLPERQRDAEQLVAAGPAPLTAEAVSLAFRRDDRRYDNGFPLY